MLKQHFRIGAAVILGVGLFMTACNKDNDNGPSATPNELKLESHSWMIRAATQTGGTATDSSIYSDCMADDSLVFGFNHHYVYADGTTVCDSTVVPYGTGVWFLNAAEDTLMLQTDATTMSLKVNLLTDSTLEVSYIDSLNNHTVTRQLNFVNQ